MERGNSANRWFYQMGALLPWQSGYRSILRCRLRYSSSALIMVSSIFCAGVPGAKYRLIRYAALDCLFLLIGLLLLHNG